LPARQLAGGWRYKGAANLENDGEENHNEVGGCSGAVCGRGYGVFDAGGSAAQ